MVRLNRRGPESVQEAALSVKGLSNKTMEPTPFAAEPLSVPSPR